jgi:iron(III) transport system ATP-binding protein
MVFQSYALFPHMRVSENISYGLEVSRIPRDVMEAKTREVMKLMGLETLGQRYPHELSGGQQQRVAVARALVLEPMVLLFDEPLSNLDAKLRRRVRQEIRELQQSLKLTVIYVTHDQEEALAVSDTIVVMNNAVVAQMGSPRELHERPTSRFVADFIGHGVFTPASLHEVDGQVVVDTPVGRLSDVSECPLPGAFEGGQCDVLLRADDIVHDDDAPVKAEIIRKAFRGSEFLYTLRLASGHQVMAHVPSHHDHTLGEWIGIRAQVDHVVTFQRACSPRQRELCQLPCEQAGQCAAETGRFMPAGAASLPAPSA